MSGRRVGSAVAVAVLVLIPLVPGVLAARSALALVALPAESIVAVIVLAVVPWRLPRIVVAVLFGAVVGAGLLAAAADFGFEQSLDIPFDPSDSPQLIDAFGVLRSSIGAGWAAAVLVGVVALALAVMVVLAWASLRVAAAIRARRRPGGAALIAVAAAWAVLALVGASIVPGRPVAASASIGAIGRAAQQVAETRRAVAQLPSEIDTDAYADLPASRLLPALRGKDVVFAFIESYGQVAVQGTSISHGVDKTLRSGQAQLTADGYSAQSAWLTSPTFGGLSWLAHSTLQTGLWIDKQPIYSKVIRSNRFTLSDAFHEAGWKTVSDVPSDTEPWPFGTSFYHYDELLTANNVDYRGPSFGYARIPDEYTWKYFADHELAGPQPVMAEVDLVSSHTPWAPLPRLVPWDDIGDGSVFGPQPAEGDSAEEVWRSAAGVQRAYGQSVQYSLGALFAFLHNVNDPNLVVIALGDHQPAAIVSGAHANHQVPISIIAKDPSVMKAIDAWHWQSGIRPSAAAPLWRMDAFRDRFLAAL